MYVIYEVYQLLYMDVESHLRNTSFPFRYTSTRWQLSALSDDGIAFCS